MFEMIRTDIGAWLAWAHLRADGAREHRRQHEPDVGDGRGRVRRRRHAAAGQRPVHAGAGDRHRRPDRGHRGVGRARRLQARREDHDGAPRRHPRVLHRRGHQGAARLAHVARAGPGARAAGAGAVPGGRLRPRARRLHPDHGHRRPGAAARGVPVLRLSRRQRRLQGHARRRFAAPSGRRCRTSASSGASSPSW